MTHVTEPDSNLLGSLENILYKFLSLHDLIAKQQHLLQLQNEQLTKEIASLAEVIAQHQKLEPAIRQQLAVSVQMVAKNLGTKLGEETRKAMYQAIDQTAYQLQRASEQTHRALENAHAFANHRFWKELAITLACSIISSILSVWLLIPAPTVPLTNEQMALYQLGNNFNDLYQKLPKREQKQLWDRLERKRVGH